MGEGELGCQAGARQRDRVGEAVVDSQHSSAGALIPNTVLGVDPYKGKPSPDVLIITISK